jgi:drug/metabolite transporter (DMT)-like permease
MTDRHLHRRGLLLGAGGALCWSVGGLLVRSVEQAESWQIVFWRALFFGLTILAVLAWRYRGRLIAPFRAIGRVGILAAVLLASANTFFIVALGYTTIANVLVLQATGPLFAALLGRVFLGESVPLRLWLVIAISSLGMLYIFSDSLGTVSLIGDALGLGIALVFAGNIVATRSKSGTDMVPAVALAALITIVASFAVVAAKTGGPMGLAVSGRDFAIMVALGMFQLGLGFLLFTAVTRHVTAAEAMLLTLLETIAGPLWAWLAIGERPGDHALIGGAIVLAALVVNAALASRAATADNPATRATGTAI